MFDTEASPGTALGGRLDACEWERQRESRDGDGGEVVTKQA